MLNTMRKIGLLTLVLASVRLVAAEDLPVPSSGDMNAATDSSLVDSSVLAPTLSGPVISEPGMIVGPVESTVDSMVGCDECQQMSAGPYDYWDMQPAVTESSGTWLRRGLWYAQADVVVLNRNWDRDSLLLASEDGFPPPFSASNRFLWVRGAHPGEDASVRVTLGRFLFRDIKNRDHSAEFTVFGGGDWVQDNTLDSPNGLLRVPFDIDGNNPSFDFTSRQTVDYTSTYSSFELNYRVKRRMRRDQMVMDANGCWHREASPGMTVDYLMGLRIMELRDIMNWSAEDILQVAGSDGLYAIRTDNDLFGVQFGGGFAYETGRWSLGLSGKAGAYVNDATGRSVLTFTMQEQNDFDLTFSEDQLSFVGESSLTGKWHMTPDFSLRAGLDLLLVTSAALAPHQANFISEQSILNTGGDALYMGVSLGFEGYW